MKKTIIIIAVLFALVGCDGRQANKDVPQWDGPQNALNSVFAIPDSLASPAELAIKRTCIEIIHEGVIIKNNRMVLTVDRDFFVEKGLQPSYYDLVRDNIQANNDGLDRWEKEWGDEEGMQVDLAKLFEDWKKEYREQQK